uniref:Uncharacterized protein n=1 Tax=Podoviridae sp. ctrTt13 TaxID=2825279 RepID=A0A8S5NSR2_9CAUD|nr:MAG TPA: hypothetical protein [Podoviridae sp. ctrTt13]
MLYSLEVCRQLREGAFFLLQARRAHLYDKFSYGHFYTPEQ